LPQGIHRFKILRQFFGNGFTYVPNSNSKQYTFEWLCF
jgi:hypothetical protein